MVRSPATLKVLPLNGTSIDAIVCPGSCAALHINLKLLAFQAIPSGRVVISTSNKLGRAPPPDIAVLKFEIV